VAWLLEIQTKGQEMKKINKDFLMDLERERLDQSWKTPKETALTQFTKIIYRDKVVDHRFRDNIMFQAGRYSMGARDSEAVNGHRVASNLIGKEGKK
jgi:hypothetical protein